MEHLDKALAREQQRLSPSILDPVSVNSVADIKRLVAQLEPSRNPPQSEITIGTVLSAPDEKTGVEQQYQVSAQTKSKSKRDMLVDGLDVIKNWIAIEKEKTDIPTVNVNGVSMKMPALGTSSTGRTWVDPLIKQWLGGYRDGIYICWNLNDGFIYRYNIYEHKLTRVESQTKPASPSPV
jgi:hypothetical protein